jgi:putative nucleotidyltransferase with HDIG domain
VDARNQYTRDHSKKVAEYALALAEVLKMEPLERSRLEACALLHDVGKVGINDEILNKSGELTAEEWEVVKTHPQLGATIVGRVPQLAHCVASIRHHHERYDGTGYPNGLKGDDIPLLARILAIANAFAAMTTARPYADALSSEGALEEIKRGAGKQFDPNLVQNFLSIYGDRLAAKKKI